MAVTIIPFESRYALRFRELNLAWLEAYFQVEEKDRLLLEDCEASIIHPGGSIFFAGYQGSIAGCFAFMKLGPGQYEFGKMAVEEALRGLGIGKELMRFAISHGREKGWERLVLYSNTRLGAALHIYREFGFREVPLETENPYRRSDIKMEMQLN